MTGLHHRAGIIYDTDIYTITPDGEHYNYPSHLIVEELLYSIIDQHNHHMIILQERSPNVSVHDRLVYLIKSAAWTVFNFVNAHPFSDGNGRMCHLLAGYVMTGINLFPVHPYHKDGLNFRQDYIDAINNCRRKADGKPSRLAALLLDALYEEWQTVTV